jgi:hypothetical protein
MNITRAIGVLATVSVLLGCATSIPERCLLDPIEAARRAHALQITGTFTNLSTTADGFFGVEVRIAVTDDPTYQAVVQFGSGDVCPSEKRGGEPCFRASRLFVVEAVFDSDKPHGGREVAVAFDVPEDGPFGGRFEGYVSDEALTGTLAPVHGRPRAVRLARGTSWWERY